MDLIETLSAELAMLNENYALLVAQAIRLLEDDGKRVSTHLGHNLGNRAAELSVIAGQIEFTKRLLAHLEVEAK